MTSFDVAARAARPASWLDSIAGSNRLAVLALLVLAALAFAPGFVSMPPMDRDEPRFAQASKQMLETGDLVNIRFQDEARLKKPVGIYWLQVAAVSAGEALGVPEARTTIALYRVPSLLAAVAAVLLTWWAGLPLVGRRAALLAGVLMASTILLGVEARLAKTDATLLATVLAMAGVLARAYQAGRRRSSQAEAGSQAWGSSQTHGNSQAPAGSQDRLGLGAVALFWTAMAVSILIKGPIGPMVIALTILALVGLTRDWRWLGRLRWLIGLVWMLVLVSPWFIAIMIETGGRFLEQSVGNDMLSKVASGQESHGAPPGTYLAAFWATFWPAAPLAALAAPWVWRNRRRPEVLYLLAWLVPSWIVFEAVPTKLPHYVLPLYPAIALLTAAALVEGALAQRRWLRWAVAALIPLIPLILVVAAAGAVWHYEHAVPWLLAPLGAAAVAAAMVAWRRIAADSDGVAGACIAAASAVLLYWAIYAAGMASLPTLWPSPRLAAAARSLNCPSPAFATAGYREPSLVFLVGTSLEMADGAGAADFLGAGPCRMAFVDKRGEATFQAQLAARSIKAALVTRVAGININGWKPLDIGVYRVMP